MRTPSDSESPIASPRPHGCLHDYQTGEYIRPATELQSIQSAHAGPEGVIEVDGRSCYVD